MEKPIEVETTRYESLANPLKKIFIVLSLLGVMLAIFYIFGFTFRGQRLSDFGYYYLLFAIFSSCSFLILPARKKDKRVPWYDFAAAALMMGISIYLFLHAQEIATVGWVPASQFNFILGLVFSVLVLEGARRMGGNVFFVVCIIVGLYPLFADQLPGPLFGISFSFTEIVSYLAFSSNGFIGLPAKIAGDMLIGFVVFAGILNASGGGRFFLDIALVLLGRYRGGPAKVAVVSSALFGSLSGSVFANILGTGAFTIPAMKRVGYPPHYAGAIEACASTGGVLMPPVMGAVAFVMASFLGVEYVTVLKAALIPALLYYMGLLLQVDAYAARVGLRGLPREEIPALGPVLKRGWPFLSVLVFLIWGLVYMRWEALAPWYASALMVVLSFASKETAFTPRRIVTIVTELGKMIVQAWVIILPIGFIMGGLNITGMAAGFTGALVSVGGENLFLILVMGVVVCYILGMVGLVTAAYIFLAITMAPAVVAIGGLNKLGVHLFLLYYSMLAGLTPPVAIAAFLGANIAGANPMKTAFQAMRLGIVIYFIPFFFVFEPSLILQGPIWNSVYNIAFAIMGIFLIAAGIEGYLLTVGKLGLLSRPFLIIAGFLFALPELKATIVGAVLAIITLVMILVKKQSLRAGQTTDNGDLGKSIG